MIPSGLAFEHGRSRSRCGVEALAQPSADSLSTSENEQKPTLVGGFVEQHRKKHYFFCVGLYSVLTVSEWRPLRRRAARTARPVRVRMRFMKPCSRLRGMRFGWYVRLGTSEPPHLSLGPPREDQRATRCFSTKMATNSPRVPALSHGHSELYAAPRTTSMCYERSDQ